MRPIDASLATNQRSLSRRRFLAGTALLAGGATLVGARARSALGEAAPARVELGSQPAGLPARQHAWGEYLPMDPEGNPISPRFDRLIFFDVRGRPSAEHVRLLESRLRTLECHFKWSAQGLLFTVSWGYEYFTDVLGVHAPIPKATARSSFEHPSIDRYHMCLHLACNDQQRLIDVTRGLVYNHRIPGIDGDMSLHSAFRWRETRTGFAGPGLPAANQNVGGIPSGDPVPPTSPLFMGFKSGLVKNQATEDRVTIGGGLFDQGTTMQVSYMRENLDGWYGSMTEQQRIAQMYAPQMTAADVAKIKNDAPSDHSGKQIVQAATKYGALGHSQTIASARENGRPLIIRRDFNTIDGGHAGLHFVSVQNSISDFVVIRDAMNFAGAPALNKKLDSKLVGINRFLDVRNRANYIMASRANRSFPQWPGQKAALS